MSTPRRLNCYADFHFTTDIRISSATDGTLVTPAAGAVTDVRLRLSATEHGAALHAAVGNLLATEYAGKPGRFTVRVDQAHLLAHVWPLGKGTPVWAVWSKAGDFDRISTPYLVWDGERIP
jgi:hypothetical protein